MTDVPINGSIIKFMAWLACKKFGDRGDGIFNSACFAHVVRELYGLPLFDGYVVSMILAGRAGIESLQGGAHWKLRSI
jgi:hypothetical protein